MFILILQNNRSFLVKTMASHWIPVVQKASHWVRTKWVHVGKSNLEDRFHIVGERNMHV